MGSRTSQHAAASATKKATFPSTKKEKKKVDPKEYTFSKRSGETLIRHEGSIVGECFNLEECKNCDIFLLDHIGTSFVDDCEDCRIFVGPVETSIFVRNCRRCSMIIACQQFRSRDCEDCQFALMVTTEPIIETSVNMQFACFDFFYFSFRDQVERAGLKVWNNKWWQVYDFNRNEDKPNWSLLPQDKAQSLVRIDRCSCISEDELAMDVVVPVTLGSRPWPTQESCFVLFLPGPDFANLLEAFLAKAVKSEGWSLCRSRSTRLMEKRLKQLFAWTKEPFAAQCKGKEVAGAEVCGAGIHAQVMEAFTNTGLASGARSIAVVPQAETPLLAKTFFETWKDEV